MSVEDPTGTSETCADVGEGSGLGIIAKYQKIMNRLALPEGRIVISGGCPRQRHELIGLCVAIDRC